MFDLPFDIDMTVVCGRDPKGAAGRPGGWGGVTGRPTGRRWYDATIRSMVGFNNRRVPALAHAARPVAEGRIGEVRHVRAQYLQDWIVDPEFPLVWRLREERAGSGALGDLGSHVIDLLQHLTGERLTGVSATQATFVTERPLPAESSGLRCGPGTGVVG